MELAKVVGPAPCVIKHPALEGLKLVLVTPLTGGNESATVAWDRVGAGIGDRVLVLREGGAAMRILRRGPAPIQTVIVAKVDRVDEYE